jgi:hypothetical protein
MTSSKSNKWIARAVIVLVALLLGTGVANANRKRLVVLDFEGDEADKVQTSFVKFLKKTHTVVSIDKWNTAADELGATKINEKNIKKVAKKLKVDGVISGNVEKRRDEYIIRLKLRSGASGALVGEQVNAKTDAPKLSKKAKGDLETELYGQIDGLESVRGSGGEEEEEAPPAEEEEDKKPSKFGGKQMKNEEETEPVKLSKKELEKQKKEEEAAKKEAERVAKEDEKKAKDDEKKRKEEAKKEEAAALATKKEKDKEEAASSEEEETPLPKEKKKKKKKTASAEEEEGIEESVEDTGKMSTKMALSPANRAVDAVVGVSMNMRKMTFSYASDIGQRPAGYKGKLVPGGFIDMTLYPLALGHKRSSKDILKNIGATAMYDQVLLVKSKDASGQELKSAQVRYAFGLVFRYPFGTSESAPVIGARLRYGSQAFKISQPAPLPSVTYSMIEPGVFFRMPLMSNKLVLDANAAFLLVTNTGQIQDAMKYGGATVTGFELNIGADYHLGEALFLRGLINYETIGFSFKKNGSLPTPTDNAKVSGARDNYYGVVVSAGYLF